MPELSTLLNRVGGLDEKTYQAYQYANLAAMDSGEAPAIVLPAGVYAVASNLTLTKPVQFAPGAKLRPANGVTVHLAGGFYAGDFDHVFDLSAGGKVTGDKSCYGHTTPQQFGAKADGVQDDLPFIEAAVEYATLSPIRDEYAWGIDVHFPPTNAHYRISAPWVINRTIAIRGGSPGHRSLGQVKVICDDGDYDFAVFFQHPGGLSAVEGYTPPKPYGAQGAVMANLRIEPVTPGGIRVGVLHNCVVKFDTCIAEGFEICGFFAHGQSAGTYDPGADPWGDEDGHGTMYGNVNHSRYVGCFARSTTAGPGFAARGNTAGIVHYDTADANGNNGAGFLDNTSVGCFYLHCHTAQNTWKVLNDGVYYMCIKGHTATADNEPGTGVDWQTYWTTVVSTLEDATWALDTVYRPCGAVNVCSGSSPATIVAHYTEGGIEKGVVPRGATKVVGGWVAQGRVIRHPEYGGAQVFGSRLSNSPTGWQWEVGSEVFGSSLGESDGAPNFLIFGHNQDDAVRTVATWRFGYQTARGGYSMTRAGTSRVMELSGTGWSQGGYSGVGHIAFQQGILLGIGGTGSSYTGLKSAVNLAGITGTVVRGQIFLYSQPSPGGKIGAVCTTAGTVGSGAVLKEFGVIDP